MLRYRLLLPVAAVALMSGCATTSKMPKFPGKDKPIYELQSSAQTTSEAMTQLASIESATAQSKMSKSQWQNYLFNLQAIPQGFDKKVSLQYVGSAWNGVNAIATLAGYKVEGPLGKKPTQPIIVDLNAKNKKLIDVMRTFTSQLGNAALVRIYGESKVIEFSYNKRV